MASFPIIISYYTANSSYVNLVKRLERSCLSFDYQFYSCEHHNNGSWLKNVIVKPSFILRCLDQFGPIIWIDADAVIRQRLSLLENEWTNFDFACFKESKTNFNSSVTFWKDTTAARRLLIEWLDRSNSDPEGWPATHRFSPQHHLADAWQTVHEQGHPISTLWLPQGYFRRFDDPEEIEPIVEHYQASRKMRGYFAKLSKEAKTAPSWCNEWDI